MTKTARAAREAKDTAAQDKAHENTFKTFDALMSTAGVDNRVAALAQEEHDGAVLGKELTDALRLAHDRWGLGLLHLRHEARVERTPDQTDIALLADGREVARLSSGAAAISAAYESMRALGADDLSQWGVLPEGHRAQLKGGAAQMRVLIEDARDFETHWAPERGGAFSRTWRSGDTLAVEVHRPASPVTALADAAWDVITSIKDRGLQRELMERSNSVGMLGALLAARHSSAARNLDRLPEAHFTVRSAVVRATGQSGRDFDRWKTMVREAQEQLDDLQKTATRGLADVLSHGLK